MSNKINCILCGKQGERAHIKSRGSGAGWEDWEWIPLCRSHHVEQHTIGIHTFIKKYPLIEEAIKKRNWEVFNGKLIHKK